MAMKPYLDCDNLDWLIAFIWPLLFITGYMIADSYIYHWFVIPVYLCGVLISVDAVHWCRGKMDTFDPKGLVGLFGCNFFVLSPILVAYYRVEKVGEIYIDDFRPWMGWMAFLNLFGIMLYRFIEKRTSQKPTTIKKEWLENTASSMTILPLIVLFTALCYIYFVIRGGGILANIESRTYGASASTESTVGMGPFFVVSRSLPMMVLITITVWFRRSGRRVSWASVLITLFVFLVAQFLVAGFTGSRSATMWALFWAVGIMHFFWRPIPVKLVIISIVPLLLFLYLYGFYKYLGARSFDIFTGQASIESLEYKSKRSFAGVLIGDMGRSDMQAGILSVVIDPGQKYDLRHGRTYLTSFMSVIPRKIWPSRPDDNGKVVAGTEILYGKGSYQSARGIYNIGRRATQIYGLAGEAMLNFGVWGVLPAFAVWGYVIGFIRRRISSYTIGDMRLLIAPYWILMCFHALIQDLDNFVEVSVFNLLIPAFAIWLISLKVYRQNDDDADSQVENLTG